MSDNINVKGFKTSVGTEALKDYKPSEDATVVEKFKAEGGIVIGIIYYNQEHYMSTVSQYYN